MYTSTYTPTSHLMTAFFPIYETFIMKLNCGVEIIHFRVHPALLASTWGLSWLKRIFLQQFAHSHMSG